MQHCPALLEATFKSVREWVVASYFGRTREIFMNYIFPERELSVGNWPFLASEYFHGSGFVWVVD